MGFVLLDEVRDSLELTTEDSVFTFSTSCRNSTLRDTRNNKESDGEIDCSIIRNSTFFGLNGAGV